jgi:hypothetical protein
MEPASLAAMVTYQTTAELDVSRRRPPSTLATVIEKSTTLTEADVPHVIHTPELKERTQSASLTNAVKTKSSPG